MSFVIRFLIASLFLLLFYGCASGGAVCGRGFSDALVIGKFKLLMNDNGGGDFVYDGVFGVERRNCNYYIKYSVRPKTPGGSVIMILDSAGELVTIINGV